MPEPKPKESGWFAAGTGAIFLIVFVLLLFFDPKYIDPRTLFMGYL